MSVSFGAYLFAGVKSDKLQRKEEVKTKVTKYNPDTGEPYEKVNVSYKHFIGNVEVEDSDLESMLHEVSKKVPGVKFDYGYGHYEDKEYVIGLPIVKVRDPGAVPVSLETINNFVDIVKTQLAKVGYTGEVSLFQILYVSY